MRLISILSCYCIIVTICLAQDEKTDFYIVSKNNKNIYGIGISSDKSGNISLKLPHGGNQRFKKGTYNSAHCPKPKELTKASRLIKAKKFDEAERLLEETFRSYCHLGWAGKIGLLQAKLLKWQNKFSEAEKVINETLTYSLSEKHSKMLKFEKIDGLIELKKLEEAEHELMSLKSLKPKVAAFKYNSLGKLSTMHGNTKEAMLHYLKTILLVKKREPRRKNAYINVIKLMQEMNDNRHVEFSKKMKEEFRD